MQDDLRKRLGKGIRADDIHELCRITQGTENDSRKEMVYQLLFDDDKRVSENAAWVLTHFDSDSNEWLHSKQAALIEKVIQTKSHTMRRLLLVLILRQPFAKEHVRTDFLDFCLACMLSGKETVSVRTLSMKLAYEQCRFYPEMREEFRTALEMMEPDELSTGVRTARRNIMKRLNNNK